MRGAPAVGLVRAGLHLGALCSLVIAWRYLEPLSSGGDFFIGEGARGIDVVLFALCFVVLPPATLILLEWAAGLFDIRLRGWLHLAFVAGLVGLGVWQEVNDSVHGAKLTVPVAGLGGGLAALAYARFDVVRSYVTVLSPAPAVVLALFLVFSPVRGLALGGSGHEPVADTAARAPVIMVVLDELPVTSLLAAPDRIDAERYPNFARLVGDATWYRNTTTVSDYTQMAVPTILSGRAASRDQLPVAAEHPNSLFTLLGGSYRLNVSEVPTDLCSEAVCPQQRRPTFSSRFRAMVSQTLTRVPALPASVSRRLADLIDEDLPPPPPDRVDPDVSVRIHNPVTQNSRFDAFVRMLRPTTGRTLDYLHLLLPHQPWRYLPDGRTYASPRSYTDAGFGRWPDRFVAAIAYQRHLLQAQFTDRLLGRLVRRLKRQGTYDGALVVVTADHGASFRHRDESRVVTETNAHDIASVPLFVKAPNQRRGAVRDGYIQSTDILPTIADELGARLPWRADGTPARRITRQRGALTIRRQKGGGEVVVPHRAVERRRDRSLKSKLALFGSGHHEGLYALGGHRELIGRSVATLPRGSAGRLRATLDEPEKYRSVDTDARALPAEVSGRVSGGGGARTIAIAVNGRVAATTRTLADLGPEYFTTLVPPQSFRRGANRIEVFAITGRTRPRLVPLMSRPT